MNFNQLKEVADGILADRNLSERVTKISVDQDFETNTNFYYVHSKAFIGFGASINEATTMLVSHIKNLPH